MYTSFYNLKTKPFQISSDPEFLWFGEKHKEALATLKYGVLDNKGFLLLTGDVGTGKTTLINSLIQSLSNDIICTSVPDPSLSKMDFFNYIASAFDIGEEFASKGAFLAKFRNFLLTAYDNNKKVLLIIDESQLLTQSLLEEIRLLSNIEKSNTKLINIFFVGQNEFNEILNQEKNRAVRQRLTLNYNIDPLTPNETQKYISHRLKVAGSTQSIFDPSAVKEVFMFSGGFPRRINVICDHALLSGFVKNCKTVTMGVIQECARELKIPAYVRNRDINGIGKYNATPAMKNQAGPVIPKARPPEKKQLKKRSILFVFISCILVLIMSWWIVFPKSFKNVISVTGSQIELLKNSGLTLLSNLENPSKTIDKSDQSKYPIDKYNPDTHLDQTTESETNGFQGDPKFKSAIPETEKIDSKSPASKTGLPSNTQTDIKNHSENKQVKPLVQDGLDEESQNASNAADEIKSLNIIATSPPSADMNTLDSDTETGRVERKILSLPDEKLIVRFKYNTNNFTDEGFSKLKDFPDVLTMHPDTKIVISGYTDSKGNQQYNEKLSEFRANIVRSFLLGRGVHPGQIEVKGLGSINPIESNQTVWGRMMNRRVEIEIVK